MSLTLSVMVALAGPRTESTVTPTMLAPMSKTAWPLDRTFMSTAVSVLDTPVSGMVMASSAPEGL